MSTQTDPSGTIVQETYDVSGSTKAEVYAQVTVTTTAQTLSQLGVTVPSWAEYAYLTPEGSGAPAIRYRADGTAPTASVGAPIAAWQAFPIQGLPTLNAMQLISATGSSVTVDISFRG